MQRYETTIVIDSLQKADDMQVIMTKVESFITNHGGTIVNKEDWGKKRLAYEINRKQYGNYYHLLFEGPGTIPALLEREYRLEESILRYLTVKAEPRNYPEKPEAAQADAGESAPKPVPVAAEPASAVDSTAAPSAGAETVESEVQDVASDSKPEPEPEPEPEPAQEISEPQDTSADASDKTAE